MPDGEVSFRFDPTDTVFLAARDYGMDFDDFLPPVSFNSQGNKPFALLGHALAGYDKALNLHEVLHFDSIDGYDAVTRRKSGFFGGTGNLLAFVDMRVPPLDCVRDEADLGRQL